MHVDGARALQERLAELKAGGGDGKAAKVAAEWRSQVREAAHTLTL